MSTERSASETTLSPSSLRGTPAMSAVSITKRRLPMRNPGSGVLRRDQTRPPEQAERPGRCRAPTACPPGVPGDRPGAWVARLRFARTSKRAMTLTLSLQTPSRPPARCVTVVAVRGEPFLGLRLADNLRQALFESLREIDLQALGLVLKQPRADGEICRPLSSESRPPMIVSCAAFCGSGMRIGHGSLAIPGKPRQAGLPTASPRR